MPKPTPFAIGAHLQTWKLRLSIDFRFDIIKYCIDEDQKKGLEVHIL